MQYGFGREGRGRGAGLLDPLGPGVAERVLRARQPPRAEPAAPAAQRRDDVRQHAGSLPVPEPSCSPKGGRSGAAVGYAHFDGSMKHSTLPMDLALGSDRLHRGLPVRRAEGRAAGTSCSTPGSASPGIAGSDFPANLSRFKPWPRAIPLLGPERTLVKVDVAKSRDPAVRPTTPGSRGSARRGRRLQRAAPRPGGRGPGPGAIIDWPGDRSKSGARPGGLHRPLESWRWSSTARSSSERRRRPADRASASVRAPVDGSLGRRPGTRSPHG